MNSTSGLQQAVGRYLVFSGEYVWKYTHNAYDFGVFGSTPLTFPIEWHNSKIPGFAGRVSVPNFHGFSALFVFSSVSSRFFNPQLGGAGAVPPGSGGTDITPFRIDHDERFNQTTHVQYQPWKTGPWVGFNWRYDSGLVAGAVPVSDGGPVDLGRKRAYARPGVPGWHVLRKRTRNPDYTLAIPVRCGRLRVQSCKHPGSGNGKR